MRKYDPVAVALHWAIGLALVGQIAFGFLLDDLAPRGTPARAGVINLHKSFGPVRQPPPWPPGMPSWQRGAAEWGHRALYACMLLMPLSGYVASNFSRHGVKFFGLALAPWGPDLPAVYRFLVGVHDATAVLFAVLIAGHIAAAAWHRRHGTALASRMNWSSP